MGEAPLHAMSSGRVEQNAAVPPSRGTPRNGDAGGARRMGRVLQLKLSSNVGAYWVYTFVVLDHLFCPQCFERRNVPVAVCIHRFFFLKRSLLTDDVGGEKVLL